MKQFSILTAIALILCGCSYEKETPFIPVYYLNFYNFNDHGYMAISKGETFLLIPEILPKNATNKSVSWSSGDSNIATVNQNGLVTGINSGQTYITATTNDGNKTISANFIIPPDKSVFYGTWAGSIEYLTYTINIGPSSYNEIFSNSMTGRNGELSMADLDWGALCNFDYSTYPLRPDSNYPSGYYLSGIINSSNPSYYKTIGSNHAVYFYLNKNNPNQITFGESGQSPFTLYRQ